MLIKEQVLGEVAKFLESMKDLEYMTNETLEMRKLLAISALTCLFQTHLRSVTHCTAPFTSTKENPNGRNDLTLVLFTFQSAHRP